MAKTTNTVDMLIGDMISYMFHAEILASQWSSLKDDADFREVKLICDAEDKGEAPPDPADLEDPESIPDEEYDRMRRFRESWEYELLKADEEFCRLIAPSERFWDATYAPAKQRYFAARDKAIAAVAEATSMPLTEAERIVDTHAALARRSARLFRLVQIEAPRIVMQHEIAMVADSSSKLKGFDKFNGDRVWSDDDLEKFFKESA